MPPADTPHIDDATLAALLDDELEASAREALESHLAACGECRELAAEAALAVHEAESGTAASVPGAAVATHPSWWRRRSAAALAMAAVLVLGIGSVILFKLVAAPPDLGHLGVTTAELEAAGPAVRSSVRDALAERFEPLPGLPAPELLGVDAVLRGETDPAAPLPLAPRWTVVRTNRPRLTWRSSAPADSWEVLLVDEDEALVAAFDVDGGEAAPAAAELPGEVRLEPGRVYLWKVNAERADGVAASPWIPFRVLAAAEGEALDEQLAAAAGDPFLEAAVLAARGLDHAALDALARVPVEASGRSVVSSFARALLERHQLPDSAVRAELDRRLGDG